MKFVIHIDGEGDEEEITDLEGSNTLEDLIQEIHIATTYDVEESLKLYSRNDQERECELLSIWTEEQRQMSLQELGFQEDVTYEIDVDNYPEASRSPVQIDTHEEWQIITSSRKAPILNVGPNSSPIPLETTGWITRPTMIKLKVVIDQQTMENDTKSYTIRRFKFSAEHETIRLECELGENGIKYPLLMIPGQDEVIRGVDDIWVPSQTSRNLQNVLTGFRVVLDIVDIVLTAANL